MCVHAWGVEDQHLVDAVQYEMKRLRLWHRRMNPDTGVLFSWLEAMHSVAGNPPTFDRMAAQMYWPSTVRRELARVVYAAGR